MPDVEYLTNAKFYFEIDGITDLLVQKVSGPEIELTVAGGDAPIGVTKGGKTQTQSVIGGVKYNSTITLTYVAGNEGPQKKLEDWYIQCHAESYAGGETKGRSNRKTGSLVVYDGDGAEGMRFNFTDLFPCDISQAGGDLSPDKAGEIAVDTLQLGFTKVVRAA
ncbi:phage tail protein [Pantanalinema sp. GBBB05]|uniref:phage tail protein n=1 Tax=Pantanalinema sp. GBBB05 TaxID=2604139 RepID=UPI001DB9A4E8|nr:phage tail protein [Pantanalinema sp. GBBB05]